jgi:transcriptional regulator with XRE-family HTH domain
VIDVALLSIIRRWHLRDQVSLREIARRLGVSRNTVRKYLRSDTTEPNYSTRRTPSALDSYVFKLSVWLKTEANKPRKQRRTLKQMHADLCALGFNGSYDRVAAFARQWKVDQLDRVKAASKGTLYPRARSDTLSRVRTLQRRARCFQYATCRMSRLGTSR